MARAALEATRLALSCWDGDDACEKRVGLWFSPSGASEKPKSWRPSHYFTLLARPLSAAALFTKNGVVVARGALAY